MPGKRSRLFVILLAGLLVAAAAVPAHASKCSARKLTAAGRYFDALARCEAKAVAKRRSPDPLCFGRAQAKLIARQEKAESKGACLTVGDVVPLQDVLDDALAAAVDVVETPPSRTCCSTGGNACHWSATAVTCMNLGGTPGAPGTLCDGSGACVFPPATVGGCCEQVNAAFLQDDCAAGPVLVLGCDPSGVPVRSSICDPAGYCLTPGQRSPSRCTSRKLKAAGHYFRAASRCESKAIAKGQPAELLCRARARSSLLRAFARAEGKGDCIAVGDLTAAESDLDDGLEIVFGLLQPPPSICCTGASRCTWLADEASCTLANGTVAPAGSVCDSVTGTCGPPPAADGPCCQDVVPGGLTETTCFAGPSLDISNCTGGGGSFVGDAVCLPSRICVD